MSEASHSFCSAFVMSYCPNSRTSRVIIIKGRYRHGRQCLARGSFCGSGGLYDESTLQRATFLVVCEGLGFVGGFRAIPTNNATNLPATLLPTPFAYKSYPNIMTNAVEFDLSQLPSLHKDNMTIAEESNLRHRSCRFIEEAAKILRLPRVAVATAIVFFHRFYAKHAFSDHDRFEVAMAAIVLAAKTEESPKKVDNVIAVCHDVKRRAVQAGKVAKGASRKQAEIEADEEYIKKLKERVLLLERVLLHTIGFELSIDHPYKFLAEQINRLVVNKRIEFTPGSDKANEVATYTTTRVREELKDQMGQWYEKRGKKEQSMPACIEPMELHTACSSRHN